MVKSVAVDGEVMATPGTVAIYSPANVGAWIADPVVYETHAKVKFSGTLAIVKATCTFNFTGTDPNGVTVAGSSDVELKASSTKLNESGNYMLLAGDSAKDSYGNTLTVKTTNTLKTA